MKTIRRILLIGLGLTVSACATVDTPTRNAPYQTGSQTYDKTADAAPVAALAARQGQVVAPGQSPVTVKRVTVSVPDTLVVSDANSYLPRGDIVWREDPPGDRRAQVRKIVQDAMNRGVRGLDGPIPVTVDIQVAKFHALTEKARYTTGGVHGLSFYISIRDAKTGELVVPVRKVRADFEAYGGQQALDAEARGETQKLRISRQLEAVIRQELTSPDGYRNATKGFIQALNYL